MNAVETCKSTVSYPWPLHVRSAVGIRTCSHFTSYQTYKFRCWPCKIKISPGQFLASELYPPTGRFCVRCHLCKPTKPASFPLSFHIPLSKFPSGIALRTLRKQTKTTKAVKTMMTMMMMTSATPSATIRIRCYRDSIRDYAGQISNIVATD